MMIPANRRNPVRIGVETALQGANAAANVLSGLSRVVETAKKLQPLFSGGPKGSRGGRSKRRSGGVISSAPFQAPVTQGFTVQSNRVGSYKQCSFGGMVGTKISGEQLFALVNTAATNGYCLQDPSSPSTRYSAIGITPTVTAQTAGADGVIGTVETLDPLFTQAVIYTRFRFTKLAFIFIPQRGTGESETLTMAWVPAGQVVAGDIASAAQLESFELSVTGPIWASMSLDCSKNLPMDRLFAQYPGVTINALTVFDLLPGGIAASVVGNTAITTFGRVFMRYELEIYGKRPYPVSILALRAQQTLDRCGQQMTQQLANEVSSSSDEKKVPQSDQKSDCVGPLERSDLKRSTSSRSLPPISSNRPAVGGRSVLDGRITEGWVDPETGQAKAKAGWF